MEVYVIGPQKGAPQAVGALTERESLATRLRKLQELAPSALVTHRNAPVEKGYEPLALRIIAHHLQGYERGNGWYEVDKARATLAFDLALRAINSIGQEPAQPVPFDKLMRYLRTDVFGVYQNVFGAIAGVSSSNVSRWESGDLAPDIAQLNRIRLFATVAGLPWDDRWIVNPPEATAEVAAA